MTHQSLDQSLSSPAEALGRGSETQRFRTNESLVTGLDSADFKNAAEISKGLLSSGMEGILPADFAIHGLDEKVKAKAEANVDKTMTPQEREQLAKDSAKYDEEMRHYEHSVRMFIGMNPPEPPAAPASVRRHDVAVDREKTKITKQLEEVIS